MSGGILAAMPGSRNCEKLGGYAMRRALRTSYVFIAALLLGLGAAAAQEAAKEPPQEQAEEPINQIRLTEQQIRSFIAAQPDLPIIAQKLQEAGEKPDPALDAELDAMARKHGFSGFAELDDVAANISLVMAGLDPETGEYTEPAAVLKKELEEVKADPSIPENDKSQLTKTLTDAIATAEPLQFPENVALVKAHRQEIETGLR
jgi:hypothetical protein